MTASQLPFVVEGALILTAAVLGGLLGKKGKPYGKVKLSFHLFFFAWYSMGFFYVGQTAFTAPLGSALWCSVLVMGIAWLVQLTTGVWMLVTKRPSRSLPLTHGSSALVLLVADLAALVFA